MSLTIRKLAVAVFIIIMLTMANAGTIVAWLDDLEIIPLAQHIQAEYITGTAIAVIVTLLILLPGRAVWAICIRRCPVCDSLLHRNGKYCGECGSRV